ncbi:hypothetical protein RBWH47_05493 [Rhodopirellula baltica WH47]|uniref:Uncharacterized protein n=1 Tax=Rhodopirellula baltica WH47 TaxID=991778 RepID=F2AMH9_RHOBT|nr:hypothetical protein RBWH47_05493 [Rhodopirellula baltica WH47]
MRARENASGRGRTEGFHGRSSCRRDGEGWGTRSQTTPSSDRSEKSIY